MRGLRTQENTKFLEFFKQVQAAAAKKNAVFFLDSGEGNQFENETIECEDLSGWLIPNDKSEEFEKLFNVNDKIIDKWNEFCTFVSWRMDGESLIVTFEE